MGVLARPESCGLTVRPLPAILAAVLLTASPAAADVLRVGPGAYPTVAAALAAAAPGDTVRVAAGVYRERLVIDRAVTLIGEGWPVLDGEGTGHVVLARAPLAIEGFVLRGSGTNVDEEHAGIMVRGAPARVVGNRLEDVFYGVYLKEAPGSLVARNRIEGKPLGRPRRGDGIRLWYSPGTRIEGNVVVGTRDVVVYFSADLDIVDNEIRDGRFGLHYMYSDDSRIVGNRMTGNEVGAFLMYSSGLELWGNVFHRAEGATGIGLGLKDTDDVTVAGNLFLENATGVHLDNSPRSRDLTNIFVDNAFVRNGSGVRWMPSVTGNRFERNDFVENLRAAEVSGGPPRGVADRNAWVGNRWGEYAGFDADGDGTGDTPYVHARLSDEMTSRHPALKVFAWSPAFGLLELLARFFPMLEPTPVVVDPAPRVGPPDLAEWRGLDLVGGGPPPPAARAAHGAGWALAGLGAVGLLLRAGRRRA